MGQCEVEENLGIFLFGTPKGQGTPKNLVCLISHRVGDQAYCSFLREIAAYF